MRTRGRDIVVVAALFLGAACPARICGNGDAQPTRFEFWKMGGIPVHVSIWGAAAGDAETLRAGVDARLDALEAKFSSYRDDSLVSRIGRGELRAVDDPDLDAVLRKSALISRRTDGAFDITVAPFVALWRQAREEGAAPGPRALDAERGRVGYRLLGDNGLDVGRLANAGGAVDLGGIAKGYMADAVLALLRERGVRRALVEIGGDMAVHNEIDDTPFRVGIRHPLRPDRLLGVLEMNEGAVVTSGNYERGFEIAGRRYGHIIDPRSGQPTADEPLSVTVATAEGGDADAWATGLFVIGADEGSRLAAAQGIEALFIVRSPNEGLRIIATRGILDRLQLREPIPTKPAILPSS